MNLADLHSLFDVRALAAIAPITTLGVGVMLLLLAGVLPVGRAARQGLVLLTLLVSGYFTWRNALLEPGLVLDSTYIADRASSLWGLLFLLATLLAWIFALFYYDEEDRPFQTEHDVLLLSAPLGMFLMASALDLIVFFIGLELLSIPLYALCSFRRNRPHSVEAGVKYFLLGAFAAAFFLYGCALLYTSTGTLSLVELQRIGAEGQLATAGVALIMASLFFKVSVFPFHLWVPDVYQGAPTPVTALMATGTKAAAFAFILNTIFLLPPDSVPVISTIAILTMALGNLGALVQTDLKRMLAYSGIAHAGTVLLIVAASVAGDPDRYGALHAALFYMGAYVFTAAGAFGLLTLLERETKQAATLDSLRGMAKRRPLLAAGLTLFMVSLGGIPLTGGFMGKWMVFATLVRAELWIPAILGVLLSIVALAYYLRVVVEMYMRPAAEGAREGSAVPQVGPTAVAAWICALFVLAMGCLPGLFLDRLP